MVLAFTELEQQPLCDQFKQNPIFLQLISVLKYLRHQTSATETQHQLFQNVRHEQFEVQMVASRSGLLVKLADEVEGLSKELLDILAEY